MGRLARSPDRRPLDVPARQRSQPPLPQPARPHSQRDDGRRRDHLLDSRLDFAGLHRGQQEGICFVAFDVLQAAGHDVRLLPYAVRRQLLAGMPLRAPISLVESTTDRATALRWWEDYRTVGIEGLVAKRLTDRYRPGQRDWLKMRHRHTVDLIVTGITGSASAPTAVILSRYDDRRRLRPVAVSLPLSQQMAQEIGKLITVIGTELTPVLFGLPGQQPALQRTVTPTITVEVATDGNEEHGRFRHAVKVLRIRHDLT